MPEAKAVICFWPNNFFFVIGIGWLFLCLNFHEHVFEPYIENKIEVNGGQWRRIVSSYRYQNFSSPGRFCKWPEAGFETI